MASPSGRDLPPDEIREMIREYYTSLSPDRFSHLTAMVDIIMSGEKDERFEFGMRPAPQPGDREHGPNLV
jgi:hypothetical protein